MHNIVKIPKLVAVLGFCLLLVGCSEQVPQGAPGGYARVLSLEVGPGAERAALEAEYGGEMIVWHPEDGLAVLGLRHKGLYLKGLETLTTDPNQDVFKTPEVTAGGNAVWGGGKRAWGGGYSAAGGTAALPTTFFENAPLWRLVRLAPGQSVARNLGAGVKVAVIDTGLDLAHPAFAGKLAPSGEWKDFVDGDALPQEVAGGAGYGHGTGVAGIILQVAPNARILPLRVLGPGGSGDVADVVAAIDWAVQKGAKVINLSLGSVEAVSSLGAVAEYAANRGVYVVSSAGNTGDQRVTYPAAQSGTGSGDAHYRSLGVGSVSATAVKSGFSVHGDPLELVAPGERLYTAVPDKQVGYWSGTSFAAPVVSGTLALGLGQPLRSPDDYLKLAEYLGQKARDISGSNPNVKLGRGLLNVEAFLKDSLGLR